MAAGNYHHVLNRASAILLLALLLSPLLSFAAQPLILGDNADTYHLGGARLDVLEDKSGRL